MSTTTGRHTDDKAMRTIIQARAADSLDVRKDHHHPELHSLGARPPVGHGRADHLISTLQTQRVPDTNRCHETAARGSGGPNAGESPPPPPPPRDSGRGAVRFRSRSHGSED